MNMKYKVGDTVKVKDHKYGECDAKCCSFMISDMEKLIGKAVTIKEAGKEMNTYDFYCIDKDKDKWHYSDCMLEKVSKPKTTTNNNLQPTVTIPKEWLDGLTRKAENLHKACLDNEDSHVIDSTMNLLLGYIESAEYLIQADKKNEN